MQELVFSSFKYPEELQEQRLLFEECFPENIGTPVLNNEHYVWKFKSFPTTEKKNAYEYIAKLNNEMTAYYAAIPYQYIINGKLFHSAMVCDVMTGTKARGKGVFTKLGVYSTNQFALEGLAFSTGYPIRPEVIPGHKKAGWDLPFEIPMYGKFLKMNSFLKTKNKQFLVFPANFLLKLFNFFFSLNFDKNRVLSVENYNSLQIDEIKGLDDFFEKWRNEQTIALNKNVEFLKWRLSAPEKNYHIIVLRKKNEIIGYSVFRLVTKENVPCIGVLDFCLLNNYLNHSILLLNEIEKCAKKLNAELILMMMLRSRAKQIKLKSTGFLKTPFHFSFIIKQFDSALDKSFLNDEKNWSLMWIDSDDL